MSAAHVTVVHNAHYTGVHIEHYTVVHIAQYTVVHIYTTIPEGVVLELQNRP